MTTICPELASTLAFGMPGTTEWIILLVLGLLIFGRRLPEVGRSLGRGIVEFKRGIKGIEDDIEETSSNAALPSEKSSPALDEPKSGSSPIPKATVGGEKANPYAAQDES